MTEGEGRELAQLCLDHAGVQTPVTIVFDDRLSADGKILFKDPPRFTLSSRLLDQPLELALTVLHETAHLLAGDNTHESGFRQQLDQLMDPIPYGELEKKIARLLESQK